MSWWDNIKNGVIAGAGQVSGLLSNDELRGMVVEELSDTMVPTMIQKLKIDDDIKHWLLEHRAVSQKIIDFGLRKCSIEELLHEAAKAYDEPLAVHLSTMIDTIPRFVANSRSLISQPVPARRYFNGQEFFATHYQSLSSQWREVVKESAALASDYAKTGVVFFDKVFGFSDSPYFSPIESANSLFAWQKADKRPKIRLVISDAQDLIDATNGLTAGAVRSIVKMDRHLNASQWRYTQQFIDSPPQINVQLDNEQVYNFFVLATSIPQNIHFIGQLADNKTNFQKLGRALTALRVLHKGKLISNFIPLSWTTTYNSGVKIGFLLHKYPLKLLTPELSQYSPEFIHTGHQAITNTYQLAGSYLAPVTPTVVQQGYGMFSGLVKTVAFEVPVRFLFMGAELGQASYGLYQTYQHYQAAKPLVKPLLSNITTKAGDIIRKLPSYLDRGPWPKESLENRIAYYQILHQNLVGKGKKLSKFEQMVQNFYYNITLHLAYQSRRLAFELGTKIINSIWASFTGGLFDGYPHIVEWLLKPEEWSFCVNPNNNEKLSFSVNPQNFGNLMTEWQNALGDTSWGKFFSNNKALSFFINRYLFEKMLAKSAGALGGAFGAAAIRYTLAKKVNSVEFIQELRFSIKQALADFLFNPEELIEFENLDPPNQTLADSQLLRNYNKTALAALAIMRLKDNGGHVLKSIITRITGNKTSDKVKSLTIKQKFDYARLPLKLLQMPEELIPLLAKPVADNNKGAASRNSELIDRLLSEIENINPAIANFTRTRHTASYLEMAISYTGSVLGFLFRPINASASYLRELNSSAAQKQFERDILAAKNLDQLPSADILGYLYLEAKQDSGVPLDMLSSVSVEEVEEVEELQHLYYAKKAALEFGQRLSQPGFKQKLFENCKQLNSQIGDVDFENELPSQGDLELFNALSPHFSEAGAYALLENNEKRYYDLFQKLKANLEARLEQAKKSLKLGLVERLLPLFQVGDVSQLKQQFTECSTRFEQPGFREKFPSLAPVMSESLKQLAQLDDEVFAQVASYFSALIQSVEIHSKPLFEENILRLQTLEDCEQLKAQLATDKESLNVPIQSDLDILNIWHEILTAKVQEAEFRLESWQELVKKVQTLASSFQSLLAKELISATEVKNLLTSLDKLLEHPAPSDYESAKGQLIHSRLNNSDAQASISEEEVIAQFKAKLIADLQTKLLESMQADIERRLIESRSKIQNRNFVLADIDTTISQYKTTFSQYIMSFRETFNEEDFSPALKSIYNKQVCIGERQLRELHNHYDATAEIKQKLSSLKSLLKEISVANALADAPRGIRTYRLITTEDLADRINAICQQIASFSQLEKHKNEGLAVLRADFGLEGSVADFSEALQAIVSQAYQQKVLEFENIQKRDQIKQDLKPLQTLLKNISDANAKSDASTGLMTYKLPTLDALNQVLAQVQELISSYPEDKQTMAREILNVEPFAFGLGLDSELLASLAPKIQQRYNDRLIALMQTEIKVQVDRLPKVNPSRGLRIFTPQALSRDNFIQRKEELSTHIDKIEFASDREENCQRLKEYLNQLLTPIDTALQLQEQESAVATFANTQG